MKWMCVLICITNIIVLSISDKSLEKNIYEEISICLDCLQTVQKNSCYLDTHNNTKKCDKKIDISNVSKSFIDTPKLLCRDDNFLTVTWNQTLNAYYFLEYYQAGTENVQFTDITFYNYKTLNDLSSGTEYAIILWSFFVNGKDIFQSTKVFISTTKNVTKKTPVRRLYVKQLYLEEETYNAIIQWKSGQDYSCFYETLWYKKSQPGTYHQNKISFKSRSVMEFNISHLEFGKKYHFAVVSIDKQGLSESSKKWLQIAIPSCIDTYKNLSVCTPNSPKNLTVQRQLISDTSNGTDISKPIYNLKLIWNKPKFKPNYYNAMLFSYVGNTTDNFTSVSANASGSGNEANFTNVQLSNLFQIKLTAWSDAGSSNPAYFYGHVNNYVETMQINSTLRHSPSDHDSFTLSFPEWIWIFLSFVIISISTPLIVFRKRITNIIFSYWQVNKNINITTTVQYVVNNSEDTKWEISETKLFLENTVGVGAFGVVQKGFCYLEPNKKVNVAVKMLKSTPSEDQISQFYDEIDIMKSVPRHPHIEYLIGVITKNRPNNPLMIVEYCAKGNLQSFLRNIWVILEDRFSKKDYINIIYKEDVGRFSNKFYDMDSSPLIENKCILQCKDLLSFARQIVVGMEFLSSLKVVHRDLATRNILLTENNTLKISDFGLSRDIYTNNIYQKITGGKLPFRWMALESLTHQVYTTQSDIWSFGIVLWEIVTLGGNPYPTVDSENLIPLLKSGYRMERPISCTEELYKVMIECWNSTPIHRPNFTDLRKTFDGLLESEVQYIRLDNVKKRGTNLYENMIKNKANIDDAEKSSEK